VKAEHRERRKAAEPVDIGDSFGDPGRGAALG